MKKLIFSFLCLGFLFFLTDANAQTTQSSSSSKDEFWGTKKVADRGSSADAVGAREASMDKRLNAYDGQKRKFGKTSFRTKKMKEIEKREKKMLKKHERDKKRLSRKRKN